MRRTLLLIPLFFFLSACAEPQRQAVFYSVQMGTMPTLELRSDPADAAPLERIPLEMPLDCGLWSLTPGPNSPYIAVQLDCPAGAVVYLLDVEAGDFSPLIDDPLLDTQFLAWHPTGGSIYVKAGTLSNPRVSRVNAASRRVRDLDVSIFAYDLALTPDGRSMLYSLSRGIGYGSETWVADASGKDAIRLWADPLNIFATARYAPDGRQLAFILFPDSSEMFPLGSLWLMDSDGQNAHQIGDADAGRGFAPAWSPDGSRIIFMGRGEPSKPDTILPVIYDLQTDRLTPLPIPALDVPHWSPDGARLFFAAIENDTMKVMFYEISSGQVGELFEGRFPGWVWRGKK